MRLSLTPTRQNQLDFKGNAASPPPMSSPTPARENPAPPPRAGLFKYCIKREAHHEASFPVCWQYCFCTELLPGEDDL